MLELHNITKWYQKRQNQFNALDNISLSFGTTGLVLLTGKSGSGKTTLLNIIGGMDSQTSGEFIYGGKALEKSNLDAYRNTQVGFVFQEYNLLDKFTIKENIAFSLDLSRQKMDLTAIKHALAKVNLPDEEENVESFLSKKANELSGGQKQRLSVARALIKNPPILLLDEPTGALDKENAIELAELLKNLSKDVLIIVSSHDKDLFTPYAKRCIELKKGNVISDTGESKESTEDIKTEISAYKSRKGRLSFLHTLKFALVNLKNKKIKLISSLLLSIFAASCLGFSFSMQHVDKTKVLLETQYKEGLKTAFVVSKAIVDEEELIDPMDPSKGTEIVKEIEFSPFDQRQRKLLNNFSDGKPIYVNYLDSSFNLEDNLGGIGLVDINSQGMIFASGSRAFGEVALKLNPETGESDALLTKYSKLAPDTECRLPKAGDEIAINDLQAELIFKYGLVIEKHSDYPRFVAFDKIDDIIGTKYNGCTITGIYATEDEEWSFWKNYLEDKFEYSDDHYIHSRAGGYSIEQCFFVSDSYYENSVGSLSSGESHSRALVKFTGNLQKDCAFIESLRSSNRYGQVYNKFSEFLYPVELYEEYISYAASITILVFIFISFLVSLNLFYTNVKAMERDLGILKAIGVSNGSVASIVMLQSAIICLFEFAFSLITISIVGSLVNTYLTFIVLLGVTFTSSMILFAVLFISGLIVSGVATVKAIRQKPINVIEYK